MESELQPESGHDPTSHQQSANQGLEREDSLAPTSPAPNGLPFDAAPIDVTGPVQISDQFRKLNPQNIQVQRISGLIFSTVVFTGSVIGLAVLWFNVGFGVAWFIVAGIAALINIASFMFSVLWPSINYRYSSWRLDAEGLEIREGVLWRHRVTIPLGRVQHADVSQGPLQRPFGIGTLTIHTAGTQHASIPLEGLAHETAIELRDLIVKQKKDQNVV